MALGGYLVSSQISVKKKLKALHNYYNGIFYFGLYNISWKKI